MENPYCSCSHGLQLRSSLWRIPTAAAIIPMENPYCSCRLTERNPSQAERGSGVSAGPYKFRAGSADLQREWCTVLRREITRCGNLTNQPQVLHTSTGKCTDKTCVNDRACFNELKTASPAASLENLLGEPTVAAPMAEPYCSCRLTCSCGPCGRTLLQL